MSRRHDEAPLYPAYCFPASPTYDVWVKITAYDLHRLERRPGFEGQKLFFHLNHPIQYVQLVGVVVDIDLRYPQYAFLEIDDGSGATIYVKINRLPQEDVESSDYPSNTEVVNVDVNTSLRHSEVLVDDERLEITSTIKVKGTMSLFRDYKQVELKRCSLVKSITEECAFWSSLALFKTEVLSKPWSLSTSERRVLEARARADKERSAQQEEEYREKWRVYNAKRRIQEEKQDRILRKQAVIMDSGALPGTDRIWYPAYMNG